MTQAIFAIPDSDMAPVTEGAMFSPRLTDKQKGDIAEKAFDLAASLRRYTVCRPSGEVPDFDFIVMHPSGVWIVVQVKWATKEGSRYKVSNNSGGVLYSADAYEVLAVYLPDLNCWVFYTRAELGNRIKTAFIPAADRRRAAKSSAPDHREMDNWNLLDEVAAAKINSGHRSANVPPPPVQMST
jgi:hypothetical protein